MARPKSDIEPRIVHAARKHFLDKGVDGASLRRIAREAHTSIGMIYYYFPTKDDLFLAVVEEIYTLLMHDLSVVLAHDVGVEERIRRLSMRVANMSDDERDVIKLVAREALGSSTRLGRLFERFQRGHFALMAETVNEGIASADIDTRHSPVVVMMATFALAAAPQVARRAAADRLPIAAAPEGEALAAQVVDILFRGIAPPGR